MSDDKKTNMKDENSESVEASKEGVIVNKVTEKTETTTPSASNKVAVLTKEDLRTLDYAKFDTPARMLALGEVLVKSALVPLKTPQDVMTALMTGKELGLPFVTSISQIYPINGRPTLGVHIQRAILLKNNIIIEKTEDAVQIYEFVKTDENGKVITPVEILHKGPLSEQPPSSAKKPIDVRTTYKFIREVRLPSGNFKEQTAYGSFSISEAKQAGLIDKDVWVKFWKRMLDARAFTIGAREIADDLLLGLLAPNELSTAFYVNEKGEEVYEATLEQ